MTAELAVLPIPRPKTPDRYDRRTTEQAFQAVEREVQNKFDRRGDLVLDPGNELVLTADNSSAMYGLGINTDGFLRLLDYSDGSIGTFTVTWTQVDGAAQEITNLTAYVDAADATLQAGITTNASSIVTNGSAISTLETEITAAREGETTLLANITDVRTAFASADAAIAADVTTLEARVTTTEGDITTNAANIVTVTSTAASNSGAIATNTSNISANSTAISTNTGNITQNAADIVTEQTARADGDSANATSITELTASLYNVSPNLVSNSALGDVVEGTGATGWTLASGFNVDNNTNGQYVRYNASGGSDINVALSPIFDVTAGDDYVISVDSQNQVSADTTTLRVDFLWYDSGDTLISASSGDLDISSSVFGVFDSSTAKTAPTGAVTAQIRFRYYPFDGSSTATFRLRRCKVEKGSSATPYDEYAGNIANTASITENATAIATESTARATADTALTASINGVSATVTTQGAAIADIEGNLTARYAIAVDGGGNGAFFSLEDGTAGPSSIVLSASDISLDGDAINLGSDTEFETTDNTFITETGGYRYRYGGPFGSSSDVLQWFGADSVAQGSETRTNGIFAFGTDGKVYYGNAELTSAFRLTGSALLTAEVSGSGAGTATTSTPGISALNATGSVTYEWYQVTDDSLASISSTSIANPTFSRSMLAAPTDSISTVWKCVATDGGTGEVALFDVRATFTNSF